MTADKVDFISAMDTVWAALSQFTELADSLECTKHVTPGHVELAGALADAMRAAYRTVKDTGNFACLFDEGGAV